MQEGDANVIAVSKKLTASDGTNFVEIYSPGVDEDGFQLAGYLLDFRLNVNISSIDNIPDFEPGDGLETTAQAEYRYYQQLKQSPSKSLGIYFSNAGDDSIKFPQLRFSLWAYSPVGYREDLLPRLTRYSGILVQPGSKIWAKIETSNSMTALAGADEITFTLAGAEWQPNSSVAPVVTGAIAFSVSTENSSQIIVSANPNRKLLQITNRGDSICYLNYGSSAQLNSGIGLNGLGSTHILNVRDVNYRGPIAAISQNPTNLEIMEAT